MCEYILRPGTLSSALRIVPTRETHEPHPVPAFVQRDEDRDAEPARQHIAEGHIAFTVQGQPGRPRVLKPSTVLSSSEEVRVSLTDWVGTHFRITQL